MLRIHLLGEFRILQDDAPASGLDSARLQSLLGYLLLHRDAPQSRQQLAYLLWPDSEESQARTNLRNLLHTLRRALPLAGRVLVIQTHTLQWSPPADVPVWLDVAEFEGLAAQHSVAALEQAAALYQGPLLPDVYEDWVRAHRDRLALAFTGVLTRLVSECESKRDYGTAIRYAERVLQVDPLRESFCCDLMRLHAANNNRAAALRVYRDFAATLRDEIGIEPMPATRAAYEALLHTPDSDTATPADAQQNFRLVGRAHEWQMLRDVWCSACKGVPQCVLVAGEAGIGKTRLAEELLTWVGRQGHRTAVAKCYAAEGALAYAPVTAWLRAGSLQDGLKKLKATWRAELAELLPELAGQTPEVQTSAAPPDERRRPLLFEAMARAVLEHNQPLLLALDDLQWCDRETLEWLHYLLRYDPSAKLLLICTVRSEEAHPEHPLFSLLYSLGRDGRVTELDLHPMSETESAALASEVIGQELDAQQSGQLYGETEGNPLFVVEMARAGAPGQEEGRHTRVEFPFHPGTSASMPFAVQAVIRRRLAQLAPAARELAELAATIGREFTLPVLQKVASSDEDTLANALDELLKHRIVRERGANAYDFSHDKIRQMAYAMLSGARRQLLHRRIGQTLELTGAPYVEALRGQIAAHYEQAGAIDAAISQYERAGKYLARLYAYQDAIVQFRKALGLLQQQPQSAQRTRVEIDIHLALGAMYASSIGHQDPRVYGEFARALELARELTEPHLASNALSGLFISHLGAGRLLEARALGETVLGLPLEEQDPHVHADVFCGLGWAFLFMGDLARARAQFERGLARWLSGFRSEPSQPEPAPPLSGADPAVNCRSFLAMTLALMGYADQAARWRQAALDLARDLGHAPSLGLALAMAATLSTLWRDKAAAEQFAIEALNNPARFSTWDFIANTVLLWARAEHSEGGRQDWLAWVQDWRERAGIPGQMGMGMTYWMCMLVSTHAPSGRPDDGLALASATLRLIDVNDEHWVEAEVLRLKARLLARSEEHEAEAQTTLLQAIATARQQQARLFELRATLDLCRLWRSQGKAGEALPLLSALCNWFTEGREIDELGEARALLGELQR